MSGASIASFPHKRVVNAEVTSPYGYEKGTQVSVFGPVIFSVWLVFFAYISAAKIFSFVNKTDFGLPVEPDVNNISASSFP